MNSLIFDMDGTLFQTDKILEISLEDTFNHLKTLDLWNEHTPIHKYRDIMGVPLPIVWETLLPDYTNEIRQQANDLFHQRLITNINAGNGALYPHAKEILNHLKENGYNVYIASNGQVEYLDAIIQFYQLDNWITETFSIQLIQSQNKSELVHKIRKKYTIESGAVIGDRLSDIKAAKDNNLISIGCNFDFAQPDELAQADFIINDLLELKTVLGCLDNLYTKQ